jgi:hypothetical protein
MPSIRRAPPLPEAESAAIPDCPDCPGEPLDVVQPQPGAPELLVGSCVLCDALWMVVDDALIGGGPARFRVTGRAGLMTRTLPTAVQALPPQHRRAVGGAGSP